MDSNDLEETISPELERLGFECVMLEVAGSTRSPVVRLYIDKPEGVNISDCARVSRLVGLLIDRLDPFPGRYLLEVSSPGSNRPLTRERHFLRFIGHTARVQFTETDSERKTYTGCIRSCINGVLLLDTDQGEQMIELSKIVKANLMAEDYKIDKKMRRRKRSKGGNR